MDNTSQITLNRLLAKLDHSLLDPASANPRLRHSQYERNRTSANIEYARTLLLTLEKQSATVRVQSQRQQTQADLQRKRELIQRLQARLQELNQLDEEDDDDDDESDSEGGEGEQDTSVSTYAPAREDTEPGLDTGDPQHSRVTPTQAQELRNRRPVSASDNLTAASTTSREQLFAARPKQPPSPSSSSSNLPRTEALISHNRNEQEILTTSLISLARALKDSSLQFSFSLEAEKDVLKRAEGGLDKSAQGMEAAERRMGMLRRMSEGQGWWGRIKLYGFIFGLWVACFVLVFAGPKLRF